jgi:diguanylate cyclase (GGDEF)-like protein
MAINGALLYGAGALMVTIFLVVPHPRPTNLTGILVAAAVAYAVTGILVLGRDWLPESIFPTLTAAGTALITILVVCDGTRPSAFELLYVWAAVYAFYFYSRGVAALEAAWIALASAAGLALTSSGAFPLFRWLMVTGTSVMAGVAVRQLVVQVRSLADRDTLTGVFSRRKYHEEIERELQRARRSRHPLALVLLDLDHFKQLNDERGHVQGDRHLYQSAQAWKKELRATDMLARFGGEEFVVVLPDTTMEQARDAADRLREVVPGGQTASAGVAIWDAQESATSLLKRADEALYEAKAAGRNATVVAARMAPSGPAQLVSEPAGP